MPRTESDRLAETFARAMESILARVVFPSDAMQPLKIGVAYSGGLDSSVLLHMLVAYVRKRAGSRSIQVHAFHIHHGLSPHADAWRVHCAQAAPVLGVIFETREVRVALNDQRGVEAAARVERYASLAKLCHQHGIPLLLTGHHRDDQAETLVLQSLRGAGIPGLAGMAAFHPCHPLLGTGLSLARPLLDISRAQLQAEADRAGVSYVRDESNDDVRFRRNAVRHDVLPLMEAVSPGCTAALARVAMHAQTALTLLDDLARLDLNAMNPPPQRYGRLPLEGLRRLSRERQGNVLRYWLRSQDVAPPSALSLNVLIDQMLWAAPDTQPVFDLGPVECRRYGKSLELVSKCAGVPLCFKFEWHGEEIIDIPQWQGRLRFLTAAEGLPRSVLEGMRLEVKSRQGGESLQPHPTRPRKSLKTLYQESAIPPWQRTRLPLLYAGQALVFAAGLGINYEHVRRYPENEAVMLEWESFEAEAFLVTGEPKAME